MKKNVLLLLFLIIVSQAFTQKSATDSIIVTINSTGVTKSEFLRIYNKNNSTNVIDNKSVKEYLDLFINFKLKVLEAEQKGLDTLPTFNNELKSYRDQLAKPYITDQNMEENALLEAYEHMKYEVHVSHILVNCTENDSPADTLIAFNKIMKIRDRIIKGEDFSSVAAQASEEPQSEKRKGDLGYFTAFQMIFPFENAAYNTKINEVSMPVRTSFGYHIIKVWDKRPARGEVFVSHVMKMFPQGSSKEYIDSLKISIDSIYQIAIKPDVDFYEVAEKYSDDKRSSTHGGMLEWFGSGQMIPDFENAAFALKNKGDISNPILTPYGWHIIKLYDKRTLKSFDELKEEIKSKISRDERSKRGQKAAIDRIKKEIGFKDDLSKLIPFYTIVDTSYFSGNWDTYRAKDLKEKIFKLGNVEYTQADFTKFLNIQKGIPYERPVKLLVNEIYNMFVNNSIIEFEKERLETKYPEFRYLMQEYHDGILLFNITEQMVWNKAIKDTIGLVNFYNGSKNNYLYGDRIEAKIYSGAIKSNVEKAKILIEKDTKNSLTLASLTKKICDKKNPDCINLNQVIVEKGTIVLVDTTGWKIGLSDIIEKDSSFYLIQNIALIKPEPKPLDEVRGMVISDYQNNLEVQWIQDLRKKYKIEINTEILETLK